MIGEGKKENMADRATDRHLRARLRRATAWGALSAEKAVELEVITEQERLGLGGSYMPSRNYRRLTDNSQFPGFTFIAVLTGNIILL